MSNDLNTLNKQAIVAARVYMGEIAWPTLALAVFVVGAIIANFWWFAVGVVPLWAAIPIYAGLTYMGYTLLHEAVHDNVSGGRPGLRWLDTLCGHVGGAFITIPYASHRPEHLTHHRYTNRPDRDPDYICSSMGKGFFIFFVYVVRFLWVQNTFAISHCQLTTRQRFAYWAAQTFAIIWRLAFVILAVTLAGCAWWSVVALVLLGYALGAIFTVYWFAYRPHIPYRETARYKTTNSFFMPWWLKPVGWFWLGQDVHSIHHLFPRVPFYRYRTLHRRIEPVMRAHGTPMVGIFSRKPVPPQQL